VNLIVFCIQEYYRLADGISMDDTNLVINKAAWKVIKDAFQARSLHIYCHLLHAGEFTSRLQQLLCSY
jgi:hypothetical protein